MTVNGNQQMWNSIWSIVDQHTGRNTQPVNTTAARGTTNPVFVEISREAALMNEDLQEQIRQIKENAHIARQQEWENKPAEQRQISANMNILHNIINGDELLPLDLGAFLKGESSLAFNIANSLAVHMNIRNYLPDASDMEAAMFREAAMRMAWEFADTHLNERDARLLQSEMRALMEFELRKEIGDMFTLSEIRAMKTISHGNGISSINPNGTITNPITEIPTSVLNRQTFESAHAAENFDTLIQQERFSAVADFMERMRADILRF